MGTADGTVLGVTKVVDHGPDSSRWNLVILGDGYQPSEIAKYHTDVQLFVDRMRATPPYTDLWAGINVHRVDVTSTESGADYPKVCSGVADVTRATYFDSTFCSDWAGAKLDRLLTCNSTLAISEATAKVTLMHQAMVIVNSSKYGGSGGDIATCSTDAQSAEIAIHEIGHSAFHLADEYEGVQLAPSVEPFEPNITLDPNRKTNKWRDLVLATTPMPTRCNGSCASSSCTPPASVAATTLTGAWEGGGYTSCNVYRPADSCYMRDYGPFCAVCTRVIRTALAMYLPPESITLMTPSITFHDIPEGVGGVGVTTWRAVKWEVIASRQLSFSVVTGPGAAFGLPLGATATTGPGAYTAISPVDLWISYTSTKSGAKASGKVTVRCDQTGQQWVVPINANTVARKTAEVVLVLDRSASMNEDAGDGAKKIAKLREAATICIDCMLPGDGIGLVRFSNIINRLKNVEDVGALISGKGRTDAIAQIASSAMNPGGQTAIGGAVKEGASVLADGNVAAAKKYDVQAIIVLTDGKENVVPNIDSVAPTITAWTFAIGLGLPANVSTDSLNKLTQAKKGYLLITGVLTPSQRTLLSKYFLQVLAGITNAQVVLDPHGDIGWGEEHRIPFSIAEADYGLDAIVLSSAPTALTFELESPDGTRFDAASVTSLGTGIKVDRDAISFFRTCFPLDPARESGTHGGTWHVVLRLEGERPTKRSGWLRGGRLPYDVIVHSWSNLVFDASAWQDTYKPGSTVDLFATLKEYDVPVSDDRAKVWAEISRPDGSVDQTDLSFTGVEWTGAYGVYQIGVYRIRVRAVGQTFEGTPFTREFTVTASSVRGREHPSEEEPEIERRRSVRVGKQASVRSTRSG